MSGDIKLHPKYGLNPTLTVCAFCGQDTGEIALLGAAYKGEAPHRMCVNPRAPCKTCEANMALGYAVLEVDGTQDDWVPLRYVVMSEQGIERFLESLGDYGAEIRPSVLAKKKLLVQKGVLTAFFEDAEALAAERDQEVK